MKTGPKQTEGWGKLLNARYWHWFKPDGRSLCGKWLSLGDPIWDTSDTGDEKCGPDTCKACHAKLLKIRKTSAPSAGN